MKSKKLIINIFACLVSFFVVLGINFFLTPYITKNVGAEAYGFVSLANNFVNYASIVTLAINSISGRFISVAVFKGNKKEANQYFTSVLIANIFILLILFIPLVCCVLYLDKIVNIPTKLLLEVKILFSLIFFNFFISIINSTYSVSTYAGNRMELYTLRNMESSIIKVTLMLILFYIFGANIIVIGIATCCATIYMLFFYTRYMKKLLPFVKVKRKYFDFKKIIEILKSGIWNTITKIGQVLSDGLDLLLCNLFVSPLAMGQLSISKTISSTVSLLTMSIDGIFHPNITYFYAKNDKRVVDETKLAMKITALFCNIILIGLIVFGLEFYKLWIPNQNINLIYILTAITLCGSLVGVSVNALFSIFTITNKLKVNSLVTLFVGFINILIIYILLKFKVFASPVIVIASVSAITMAIKNLTFIPIYSAKCLNVRSYEFYSTILRTLISGLVLLIVFSLIKNMFNINSWISLLSSALISGIVGFVLEIFVLFKKEELNRIYKFILSKLKR